MHVARLALSVCLGLALASVPACHPPATHPATPRAPAATVVAPATDASPAESRRDVAGRLRYRDGAPAARTPYAIETSGHSRVATTDDSGRISAPAILPATEHSVTLRLLDGFGVGLSADDTGQPSIQVPCSPSGQMADTYLLDDARAMVLVTAPEAASSDVTRAIVTLDLIGVHDEREILTMLSPPRIAQLRALGVEVLVIDVDANSYAARTSEMTSSERSDYIDARIARARAELRRLRERDGR